MSAHLRSDSCHLLRLPNELLLDIIEHVAHDAHPFQIFLACRLLYIVGKPFWFHTVHIRVSQQYLSKNVPSTLDSWPRLLVRFKAEPELLRSVRHVSIIWPYGRHNGSPPFGESLALKFALSKLLKRLPRLRQISLCGLVCYARRTFFDGMLGKPHPFETTATTPYFCLEELIERSARLPCKVDTLTWQAWPGGDHFPLRQELLEDVHIPQLPSIPVCRGITSLKLYDLPKRLGHCQPNPLARMLLAVRGLVKVHLCFYMPRFRGLWFEYMSIDSRIGDALLTHNGTLEELIVSVSGIIIPSQELMIKVFDLTRFPRLCRLGMPESWLQNRPWHGGERLQPLPGSIEHLQIQVEGSSEYVQSWDGGTLWRVDVHGPGRHSLMRLNELLRRSPADNPMLRRVDWWLPEPMSAMYESAFGEELDVLERFYGEERRRLKGSPVFKWNGHRTIGETPLFNGQVRPRPRETLVEEVL